MEVEEDIGKLFCVWEKTKMDVVWGLSLCLS